MRIHAMRSRLRSMERSSPRAGWVMLRCIASALLLAGCAGQGSIDDAVLRIIAPRTEEPIQGPIDVVVGSRGRYVGEIELLIEDDVVHRWTPSNAQSLMHTVETADFADGMYRLEVRGTLNTGETLSDATVLTFDNFGPDITIVEPLSPDVFVEDGAIPVVIEVSDAALVDNVSLFAGDELLQSWTSPTRTTFTSEYDPRDADGPSVLLRVEARDRLGRESETGLRLNVLQRELFTVMLDSTRFGPVVLPDRAIAVGTDDRLTIVEPDGSDRCEVVGTRTSAPLLVVGEERVVYWSTIESLQVISFDDCSVISTLPEPQIVTGVVRQGDTVASINFAGLLRLHTAATGAVVQTVDLAPLSLGVIEVTGAIAISPEGIVYVGGAEDFTRGAVFARTPEGEVTYESVGTPFLGGAAADSEGVVLPGADGIVYRYGPDLTSLWRTPPTLTPAASIDAVPAFMDNSAGDPIVVSADGRAGVHGIDLESGELLWSHTISDSGEPVRGVQTIGRAGVSADPDRGLIAVGDALGGVSVIDRDGALLSRSLVSLGERTAVLGQPAIAGERVIAVDNLGLMVVYQLTTR